MKKRLFYFLTFFIFSDSFVYSQTIGSDSRGKEVFNFYKTKSFSVPITASTSSAKINYTFKVGGGIQYYIDSFKNDSGNYIVRNCDTCGVKRKPGKKPYDHQDSLRFTMAKSIGINISFGAGNILSNLTKVSTFHPTYTLSVGVGKNIDAFNNWDNIRTLLTFFTWNLNLYGNLDNVIIYDTISKSQSRKNPFSKGVTGEWTQYFPTITKNWEHSWLVAISGSINYENGNNISKLKSFQKNKSVYSNTDIISLGDYVGKLGDLKNQNSFRGRISIPLFPHAIHVFRDTSSEKLNGPKVFKDSLQLCIIPYYSFYGTVNTHLSHLVGLYLNASQGQNIFVNNSTIVSGFGIGIDWIVASNGLSNASVFVTGSLDIHALFDHKTPKKQ